MSYGSWANGGGFGGGWALCSMMHDCAFHTRNEDGKICKPFNGKALRSEFFPLSRAGKSPADARVFVPVTVRSLERRCF